MSSFSFTHSHANFLLVCLVFCFVGVVFFFLQHFKFSNPYKIKCILHVLNLKNVFIISRFYQSTKSSGLSSNLQPTGAKADHLREEMEEAANRMEICRVSNQLCLCPQSYAFSVFRIGKIQDIQTAAISCYNQYFIFILLIFDQPSENYQVYRVFKRLSAAFVLVLDSQLYCFGKNSIVSSYSRQLFSDIKL